MNAHAEAATALDDLLAGIDGAPHKREDPLAWLELAGLPRSDAELARLERRREALLAQRTPGPATPAERLAALRGRFDALGLDGFVVARGDEHLNEYVASGAERLAWISGFTGSAGAAVVTREAACLFVDGRYTLQAAEQTDAALWMRKHLIDEPPLAWVRTLPRGFRLGYDPRLHAQAWAEDAEAAMKAAGGTLVAVAANPVDAAWSDRPAAPISPVIVHPLEFAGRSAADKRRALAEGLAARGLDAAVLTQPDSIAWLLNIRGFDVPNTPLPLAFALAHADATVDLYIDARKFTAGIREHLGPEVRVHAPDAFATALEALGARAVSADPARSNAWVFQRLAAAGARIRREPDPLMLPKACKNAAELAGLRAAHVRDGVAITRLLAWLSRQRPGPALTELAVVEQAWRLRAEGARFHGLSFGTISAAGPHAALPHYRASQTSNRALADGEIYLIDSGAQYLDGTTDITRTTMIGAPSTEMRDRYTRVLKGHIALDRTVFPSGTSGAQLDVLARQFLWVAGLDYDHGTGHGVGMMLSVHEGPQRIAKGASSVALAPGMVLSDEPGYYKAGEYGIRIENLVVVREVAIPDAERPMLGFEALTLAPIERRLIEPGLLTPDERAWIDAYHARVHAEIGPHLDAEDRAWLEVATAAL